MIEAVLPGGAHQTVGYSFNINPGTTLKEIEDLLNPFVENFEAQSGSGEDGPQTESSLVRILNITEAPNPEARPFSSAPENVKWSQNTNSSPKGF